MLRLIAKVKAFTALTFLVFNTVYCQFAPAADMQGTTAIAGDSSIFVEWASGCTVVRGPMNIADPSLGYASAGDSTCALGPAGQNGTVSLGDGGTATVTFNYPIYNGPGFDFAVFENGFMTTPPNLAFLELGFVEVSSDGVNFFRFPAITDVQDTSQLGNDGSIDCSQLYDLAGKYIYDYGTPFDLEEVKDTPGLDVNHITYVRIVDVIGTLDTQYASHDSRGRIVNDPYPTPFPSCGFDLDAVGVINAVLPNAIVEPTIGASLVYPNPVKRGREVAVETLSATDKIRLFDLNGEPLLELEGGASEKHLINTESLSPGVYVVNVSGNSNYYNVKLVVE